MNKCVITEDKLKDISNDTYLIGEDFMYDEQPNARERFINNLYTYIESISDLKNNDLEITDQDIDLLSNAILDGIFDNYIEEDDELNFDNIKSKVLNVKRGLIRNKTNDSISTETVLKDIEESQDIKERSRAFLDLSYGLAKEVQRQAQLEINSNLFDALFINRGSINTKKGTVISDIELNNNIRQLQLQLLDKICTYLKSRQNLTQAEKDLINNAKLYRLSDKGWENTKVLTQIYQILAKYTNQNRQSPERLRYLYNQSKNGNQIAKLELDAYNAYVFLKHFDSYLQLLLGKAIQINPTDFGKKTGKNMYSISKSTADLATTWRVDENISVEDEIDNITQLAINTTRIYKYDTNSPTDRYMTFQYFQNILGKIKELGTIDIATQTIFFGKDFYDNMFSPYYKVWDSFSTKTKNLIKDKSLATVINIIRQNPIQNLPVIFEILSNLNFREAFKDKSTIFTKYFVSEELDHIYSIHKQVLGFEGDTLRKLSDFKLNTNYYQYISQASDAIFKNQFIQYFNDENGHIKCRVLTDTELSNQSRKFLNDIISNGLDKSINISDFNEVYLPSFNRETNQFIFKIPGTPIQVVVNPKTEFVSYAINDKPLVNYTEIIDLIIPFLDTVLLLGIKNNSNFLSTYYENVTNPNIGIKQLLDFASNIIARQYISSNIISKIKDSEGKVDILARDSKIEQIFGDTIKYSQRIGQIQLISNSNISKFFIRNIAKTRFALNGMVTSTQVKDSQQASQNLQSLSRLLGAYGSLVDLIEKLPDSVTKNLKFINTPGLFKGHYTTSEYYDPKLKKSKKATKFTVAEMFYANFVTNYITGLTDSESLKYDQIHGNLVSFLASVNSDKNTIGLLYIDMNIPIDYNGQKIPVKDLTTSQIQELIAHDFGIMYSGILDNINQDYSKLFTFINNELHIPFQYIDNGYIFNEDYINNFLTLNRELINNPQLRKYGNTPIQIIKKIVEIYNQSHKFNPIELVDLIHFTGKKNLESNQTLVSQIARFNPEYFIEYIGDGSINLLEGKNYPTFSQFFQQKEGEILSDLLKSKFEINLLNGFNKSNKTVPLENQYLSKTYPEWTNRQSGKVILGKVTLPLRNGQLKIFNIISSTDLKKIAIETGLLEQNIISTAVTNGTLQLHPELSRYNYLDYFFTQSWMNTTVGSFIAHPDKSKSQNVIEQEASRFQAQHKRNVSMTAQMHPFLLNALNGITEEYNIAVIEDIKDFQSTLADVGIEIKPYDGATFVNPFTVYLENNSLGGSKAGFDKKQFVHFKSHRTGNGGIIKTAGFAINNDRLRRSPNMWYMMRKMTDITWLNDPNNPNSQLNPYATVNILQSNLYNQPIVFGDIYFERKGHYYKVNSIQSLGNNEYSRIIQEVDKNGNSIGQEIIEEFKGNNAINSNFKLWEFFGAARSMTMTQRGLEYSESSIENVVKVMNNVGTLRFKSDGTQYSLNEVESQTEFFQPLKQVDIHYLATAGAVKQGAANINSSLKYTNNEPLSFLRIKMYQAGILLDKEHHADNAELSLPTLIISAAAALGYTIDKSTALYEGLANAAELGIKDLLDATDNLRKNDTDANREALTEKVLELIVKNLATGNNSGNFAAIIATSIRELVHKDPELSYMKAYLPLSDNTVFSKMISTINAHITNQAIKLKIDGLLAVLTPSHNLFKLFGNKTYDLYKDPNAELEIEQQKLDENPAVLLSDNYNFSSEEIINQALNQCSANISLERTYKVVYNESVNNPAYDSEESLKAYLKSLEEFKQRGDESNEDYEERILLETLKEMDRYNQDNGARIEYVFMSLDKYRKLRDDIRSGKVRRVTEYIKAGRNLGPYNVRANTKDRSRTFQLWDLDSIRNVHELLKLKEESEKEAKQIIKEQNIITPFDQGRTKYQTLENKFKEWYFNRFGFNFSGEFNYDRFLKALRTRVQKELENLSESVEDKVEQFDKLIQSGASTDQINAWALMNLTELQFEQIAQLRLPTIEEVVNKVREVLIENQKVKIDGQLYDVDKSTLDITAYELIMPKTFVNEFFNGEEFVDLDAVKQDEDYFIKQALRLKAPKLTNNNQYDVELKRGDGNHFYLIDSKHLPSTLNPIEDEVMTDTVNGKVYRTDIEGNTLYELLPGTLIYTDSNGNEVFVISDVLDENGNTIRSIDTINKYIESLHYNNLNLSLNLINDLDYLLDLITTLEDNKRVGNLILNQVEGNADVLCKSDQILEFLNKPSYKDSKFATPESILEIFKIWNQVNELNYKDILNENHPIIKAGHIKHSSFLKSLDIVAARIPSLSLQSFMPMKVVAYDNPNRNAAYVSTLLILLQGSDFDIDAVSLVTFNINSNGNVDTWSPYSNLETINNLLESMRLPFPTGKDVEFNSSDDATEMIDLIKKFRHILNFRRTGKGEIKVSLKDINNPQNIKTLGELLNIKTLTELSIPTGIIDFRKQISLPITILLDNGQVILNNILPFDIKHPDDVKDIIIGIAEIINKHNNYLKDTDKNILDNIIKNYTINQLYDVIKDPANLVQAQTSVDATTEAFKDIAKTSAVEKDIKTRTAGNSVNKVEAIGDNQVGKDCISICAVGIKGYFALTQYANEVLNNGTEEDQARLIGKVGDFTTLLSNIRAKNVSTITNQEVLNLLVSAKDMDDQVLALSALLSLSTDNAKELALAKLNAGINMISTYIYGITIGYDFKEISKLLMSETGEILRDIVDENNMQNTPGYNKLRNAFDYFEKGPWKHLKKFDSYYDHIDIKSDGYDSSTLLRTPLDRLEYLLLVKRKDYSKSFLLEWIEQSKESKKSLTDLLTELDKLKDNYVGSNTDKVRFNQLLDFAQEYTIQYYTIKLDTLKKIKFLTDGAYEMEILGKIVGLNQGIPTDLSGFINKCGYIENALENAFNEDKLNKEQKKLLKDLKKQLSEEKITYNQYKSSLKDLFGIYEINLLSFAFDENYRKQCITDYEKVKHSFNILDVVDKLPHVLKYVQALAVADTSIKSSYRYRSIKANYKDLVATHGSLPEDIIKGLNNYIGDQIIQDWMLSENIEISIPEGNKVFNKNGELSEKELEVGTSLKLGSEYANASFRMWVEKQVIPDLKKLHSDNLFILGLVNDTRNNTLSGNGSVIYTLPINMLPRTDQERAIFNIYMDSFNDISKYPYDYKVKKLDNNGNVIYEDKTLDINTIFILYSMIAHNWKLGESSLVSILEGFQNEGMIKRLHEYTAKLDYSGRTLELNSIERTNLIPYLASKKGIYSSFSKHAWNYNKETELFELWSKLEKKYQKNEELNFNSIDPNYFPGVSIRDERKLITKNIRIKLNDKLENFELTIKWSQGNGNDEVIIFGNAFLTELHVLKDIKTLPVKSQYVNAYRMTLPDIDKIKKLIQAELDLKPETCNTPS